MKKYFFYFLLTIGLFSCTTDEEANEMTLAPIFEGDVVLKTQTAVDSFATFGYGGITGKLQLTDEFEPTDPILNLEDLSSLTSIGGDLILTGLDELISISGFENLETLSGNLFLYYSPFISSLEPLRNLTSEMEVLEIGYLLALERLDGLENISIAPGGQLIIEGNLHLENLDALKNGMPTYMRMIRFGEYSASCGPFCNPDLFPLIPQPFTSFDFLQNVKSIESLRIRGFAGTEIIGLENLETVSFVLTVWYNDNLESIEGLSGITSEVKHLFIPDNKKLKSFDGLENIAFISESILAWNNTMLTDFCAIQNNLSTNIEVTDMQIIGNAYNPTIQDIIDGNCSN